MVIEYRIQLDGVSHPVIISDEPEALLAAQAAGRAIIGVQGDGNKWYLKGVSYVIPGFEDASRELAQLVLRRHLGLPWLIASIYLRRSTVPRRACSVPGSFWPYT